MTEPSLSQIPAWLPKLCRHVSRDCSPLPAWEFAAFKFLFAMQNPQEAFFAPLYFVESTSPLMPDMQPGWIKQGAGIWKFHFRISMGEVLASERLPTGDSFDVWVLPYLVWTDDNMVMSDADLIPWEDVDMLVQDSKKHSKTGTPRQTSSTAAASLPNTLADRFPWLTQSSTTWSETMQPSGRGASSRSASGSQTSNTLEERSQGSAPQQDQELTDQALEEVFTELEEKRQEWQVDGPRRGYDFKTSLLGGAWLQATQGRAYDAFKAEARTPAAKSWCTGFGLPRSARYDVRLHGERAASVMSLAWAHRLQYFFDLWLSAGSDPGHTFSQAEVEAYQEPSDLDTLFQEAEGQTLARAQQIRALIPRSGPARGGAV